MLTSSYKKVTRTQGFEFLRIFQHFKTSNYHFDEVNTNNNDSNQGTLIKKAQVIESSSFRKFC